MYYRVSNSSGALKGKIQLTPSKSISNRVLIIRALCNSKFEVRNLATANDTVLLQKLLASPSMLLNAEDAGTAFRFLTAYLSQKQGEWLLAGSDRMKERPIGILVDGLRKLGAEISYTETDAFPPLKITGKKLRGGELEIDGSVSSQFISSLLLISPTLKNGLKIKYHGELTSQPYVEMTLNLMNQFGIKYEWNQDCISVTEQTYLPKNISIESDWSAASYWYEMAALADDVDIRLEGLIRDSIQGDARIAEIMILFGVETEFYNGGLRLTKKSSFKFPEKFTFNFQSHPDLLQTMAVTCSALGVEGEFKGVQNLRFKETDRLKALQTELKKIGITSKFSESGFSVSASKGLRTHPQITGQANSRIQTYQDHRMAMSFAPISILLGEVEIENPDVVKKSYPQFWDDLRTAGFEIREI